MNATWFSDKKDVLVRLQELKRRADEALTRKLREARAISDAFYTRHPDYDPPLYLHLGGRSICVDVGSNRRWDDEYAEMERKQRRAVSNALRAYNARLRPVRQFWEEVDARRGRRFRLLGTDITVWIEPPSPRGRAATIYDGEQQIVDIRGVLGINDALVKALLHERGHEGHKSEEDNKEQE